MSKNNLPNDNQLHRFLIKTEHNTIQIVCTAKTSQEIVRTCQVFVKLIKKE